LGRALREQQRSRGDSGARELNDGAVVIGSSETREDIELDFVVLEFVVVDWMTAGSC
jgi:hypothetical protein